MNIRNKHNIIRIIFNSFLFSLVIIIVYVATELYLKNRIQLSFYQLSFLPCFYIVFHLYLIRRKRIRLLRSDIHKVDIMSGTDFELFLFYHLKNMGYKVRLTPVTHDFGADLIVKYKGKITVIQAKRWNESVGIRAVQEVVGAIEYYHANYAMVITNSVFTKSAKILAEANEVELINRKGLIHFMEEGELGNTIEDSKKEEELMTCPFCGGKMIIRNGNYGKFYGCLNYPNCRFTKNIS